MKEFNKECTELDELEYLNNLVAERMKALQYEQYQRECEMERRRVEHERRVNAVLRMFSVIGLYTAMVVALVSLAWTGVVVWWLSGSVAVGLALCGAFRAGYYWREHEI